MAASKEQLYLPRQEYLLELMHGDRLANEARKAREATEQAAEQQAMARKLAKAHRTRLFRFINRDHSAAPTPPLKRCLVGLWEKFKRNAPKATEQHATATQSAQAHHSAAPTPPLKQSLVGLLNQFGWNARKEDKKEGMVSSTSPQSRFPFS
jgi:hypothetical protein